jgi:hypothetical protein
MKRYSKAVAAIVGAGVTAALGIWGPETPVGQVLVVVAAVLTAVSVYGVSNEPAAPSEAPHTKY